MGEIEDLLRLRRDLLEEIDRRIAEDHTKAVALLFTDIVGSTGFYERMGDIAGRQMLQVHNDLLFPIIESFGGRIIKTIGDSIMAGFEEAARAVQCTVAMQEAIQSHNRKAPAELRFAVRMGVHCGLAMVEEKDLFGDVVNTAARVESRADGGEILVSGAVKQKVGDPGIPFILLGSEEIRGKKEKVEFYAVNWQGLTESEILESWKARTRGREAEPSGQAGKPSATGAQAAKPAGARIRGRLDPRKELEALPTLPSRGNPYLNRVMIPHPGMFYGRKALVKRVMSRVSAERPQSVSLVGERRIGKSSLLNYLRQPATRLELLENPELCIPLFIDFQQTRALDEDRFIALIFSEAQRRFGDAIDCGAPALGQGGPGAGAGPRRLGTNAALDAVAPAGQDEMLAFCQAVADAGMRLAFLFDEFECVTKNEKIGPEFYSFLRSLANNYPVCFITASGRGLKDLCVSKEISDSPFFNIFTVAHVGLFSREDAVELVGKPSEAHGIPLAPLADDIIGMGGLYPFFLQIACSAWFEYLEGEGRRAEECAGKPAPREVLETFREETRPHFEFILQSASREEAEILRSVSKGDADPSLPAAADLERKGYLTRKGDRLAPFSAGFAAFLDSAGNGL
jgi:class 3 adenylate cyclase